MNNLLAPGLPVIALAVCFFSILLVPLAPAGLALINTGLGRSRSAAHMMLASLCVMAVATTAYFAAGFAWQGFAGLPAYSFTLAGRQWNWIAAEPFLFRGLRFGFTPAALAAWLGIFSAGLAAMIPLGSGADRWRLGACCASTALLAGLTYPLFAHWVWGGGWLAQLGTNCGLGQGFIDAGGSSSIQAVGGLTALSIAWILGPRRGKYTLEGIPTAIPGHNIVFVLLGCMLAWMGWLGVNIAGAILYAGVELAAAPLIAVNTTLSAAGAALAAVVMTRVRFHKPDASLAANGWIGGLVASSAACAFLAPGAALAIGLIAGAVVTLAVEWLEVRLGVDDPSGAVSVHAVGGIWGVLAVAIFVPMAGAANQGAGSSANGQWLAQLVGITTLVGLVLPLTYGLNWILNRFYPMRATLESERQGMDLSELGAGAYPEFLTRTEDFTLH